MSKPGRNDPCPCGSGKKYKKCCLRQQQPAQIGNLTRQKMRKTEGELIPLLIRHAVRFWGPDVMEEAWHDFNLGENIPLDPQIEPDLDQMFLPWFAFNWIPDNTELPPEEHFPEKPVARHYLERESRQLDSFTQKFIEEACSQPYSFFVITSVEPGVSLTLQDLLLKRTVRVLESTSSQSLHTGDIIYSRIVTLDEVSIMLGCGTHLLPPSLITPLTNFRHKLENDVGEITPQRLLDLDGFTRSMYRNVCRELRDPKPPQLSNSDGEPLQPTKLLYDLHCSPQEAAEALATLSLFKLDEMEGLAKYDTQGDLVAVRFPWLRKGSKSQPLGGNTVLGEIVIEENRLTIEVNSQERAESIKRKITRRLGRRAVLRNAVIESMDGIMDQMQQISAPEQPDEDLMNRPEVQEMVREMAEKYWKEWMDTPVPALNDQTPREAAGNERGRELLEALLLQFENHGQPQPFDPDWDALRRELGLEK